MIVESESFLCCLIVDDQRSKCRIRGEDCFKFKTETSLEHPRLGKPITFDDLFTVRAAKQFAVIQRRQRITLWHTRDLSILMIGRDDDVIRLGQDGHKTFELVGIVCPIDLQGEVVVAVQTAIRIVTIHPERQRKVIIGFVDHCGAGDKYSTAIGFDLQNVLLVRNQWDWTIQLKGQPGSAGTRFRRDV